MWRRAARLMPRISAEEWTALDPVGRWLLSSRSSSIVMIAISALIGGVLSFRFAVISIAIWLVYLVALVLAHATINLLNDLIDFRLGADTGSSPRELYGPHPLGRGLRSTREQLLAIAANGLVAIAAGAALVIYREGFTLALMLLGAFFVLFYTYPLKRFALGEISMLISYGPLAVGGGYYVLTGAWSWSAVIASLPFALGATASIMAKHIDKAETDRTNHTYTLPVLMGERASRLTVIALIVFQFLITGYLVYLNYFSPVPAVILLALLPFFRRVLPILRKPRPAEKPARVPADQWPLWFAIPALRYAQVFGVLYVLGIIADTALRLLGVF